MRKVCRNVKKSRTEASFYHAHIRKSVCCIQTKTQNQLMDWMQRNHNYVAPPTDEQTIQKVYNGKDFLSLPGDGPTTYGRNVARVLWSKSELVACIMSPGKDLDYMQTPRLPMTPTRKALFRGTFEVFQLQLLFFLFTGSLPTQI